MRKNEKRTLNKAFKSKLFKRTSQEFVRYISNKTKFFSIDKVESNRIISFSLLFLVIQRRNLFYDSNYFGFYFYKKHEYCKKIDN